VLQDSLKARVRPIRDVNQTPSSQSPTRRPARRRARNAALAGGLPEVALGLMLAGVGIAAAMEGLGNGLASVAAFVSCTVAAIAVVAFGIRRVTGPRAGWAALDRAAVSHRRVGWPAWAVALSAQLVVVALLLLWTRGLTGSTLPQIARSAPPLLTGALVGSALTALAVALRSTRLFACAAVAGGAMVCGEALGSALPLLLTAVAVLVVGVVCLVRFIRRYPLGTRGRADHNPVSVIPPGTSERVPGLAFGEPVSEGAVLPCAFEVGPEPF
jgi:hypothetical protein